MANEKNPVGRPLKFKSVEELEEKIFGKNGYFETRAKEKRPFTLSGLAVFLDCDRDTLLNYRDKPEYFSTIKRAKAKVLEQLEERALNNEQNTVFTIFNLKNNFGYADKVEVTETEHKKKVFDFFTDRGTLKEEV